LSKEWAIILVLDTQRADEDFLYADDRWISTLRELKNSTREMIQIFKELLVKKFLRAKSYKNYRFLMISLTDHPPTGIK